MTIIANREFFGHRRLSIRLNLYMGASKHSPESLAHSYSRDARIRAARDRSTTRCDRSAGVLKLGMRSLYLKQSN